LALRSLASLRAASRAADKWPAGLWQHCAVAALGVRTRGGIKSKPAVPRLARKRGAGGGVGKLGMAGVHGTLATAPWLVYQGNAHSLPGEETVSLREFDIWPRCCGGT
jgi:hypothetical protein